MAYRGDGVLLAAIAGLTAIVVAVGAFKAKEVTEALVFEAALGSLHRLKIYEGEFSFGTESKFAPFHWVLEDLDENLVHEGYAGTLQEAREEANEAFATL